MREKHYQLIGWILFIICSFLYTYDSFISNNLIAFIGGIAFFLGCIAFIIPLLQEFK